MLEELNWFRLAFRLHGSVAPIVLLRVLLLTGFGVLVSLLYALDVPIGSPILGDLTSNVVVNLVLGLLLVFRTNSAYDRFWEGRKAWGKLVVNSRNLAREIRVAIAAPEPGEQAEKAQILQFLSAFALATKFHLRQQAIPTEDLKHLLPPERIAVLNQVPTPPLEIILWLGEYLQQQFQCARLDSVRVIDLNHALNHLVDGLTTCERILNTPTPIAYTIYLRRLILIYCMFLPFHLVIEFHWWTGFIVAVISFVLVGIEEVSNELENPFGVDSNDLPLEQFCETIAESVERAANFTPAGSEPVPLPTPVMAPLDS